MAHWFCCHPHGLVPDSPKGATVLRKRTRLSPAADTAQQGTYVSGEAEAELVKIPRVAAPRRDAKYPDGLG